MDRLERIAMAQRTKPPFRADHVGSLLRPKSITDGFRQLGSGAITQDEFTAIQDEAIGDVIKLQEDVGLQSITDGEFRRASYWSTFVERVEGLDVGQSLFTFHDDHGHEQSFTAPIAVSKVARTQSIAGDEFAFLKAHTSQTPKTTMVSPPTMHLFRLNETFQPGTYTDYSAYFADLAEIYRAEINALAAAGCTYIQLDDVPVPMLCDPAVQDKVRATGLDPDQLFLDYIDLFNACLRDKPESVTAAVHMCRGNYKGKFLSKGGYETFAERFFNELNVDAFFLEYDSPRAGDFEPLKYVPADKMVVLGLVSSKSPQMESEDDLRRRIDEAAGFIDLDQLGLSPQCGFASTVAGNPVTVEVEKAKLARIVEIADKVWA
jgi:5-methyltetrahydropteroyltriglutamate--homocysteine methyltransferase